MPATTRRSTYCSGILFFALLWAVQAATAQAAEPAEPGKAVEAPKAKPAAEAPKPSQAAEPAKKPAPEPAKPASPAAEAKTPSPLEIAARDPDFAMQGEFVGPVSAGGDKYERMALQIRPAGDGRFEAIQYRGGLPGEPSHRGGPVTLLGKRWEKFLVLSGGPWAIFVQPDHCLLIDAQGQRVGRLERMVRQSPTLGAAPPKDAIVLFDGQPTSQFTNARLTEDGLLMEGADVRPLFQDFNLHIEFMLPYVPAARDQGRGNSGVYLQSRYEVQILDSFAQEPNPGGCGALYRFRKPDVNMCFPPLVWQTYDIVFTAPRWASDGAKLKGARITVWHNGVKVHDNVELANKTGAGKPEEPTMLPIRLQDHKNPVRFRNIWLVDRGAAPPVGFPVVQPAAQPGGVKADTAPKTAPGKPGTEAKPAQPPAKSAAPAAK